MELQAQWIVGFLDGQGSFHIGIKKNKELQTGFQILPEFVIVQHFRNIKVLYALKTFFGCGVVRSNSSNGQFYAYKVRDFSQLRDLILPFFEKHKLKTIKRVQFEKFRDVLLVMEKKEHLTELGLLRIREIKKFLDAIKDGDYSVS